MAAAIVVFFWSLDRIRKERIAPPRGRVRAEGHASRARRAAAATGRRQPQPAAQRERQADADGRPGARRPQHHPRRVPADPDRRGRPRSADRALPLRHLDRASRPRRWSGSSLPPLVMTYLQRRRQNLFNEQLTGMLQLLSNSLKTGYAIDRALETVASKSQPPVSTEFERVDDRDHARHVGGGRAERAASTDQQPRPRVHRDRDPAAHPGRRQPGRGARHDLGHPARPASDQTRHERADGAVARVGDDHHRACRSSSRSVSTSSSRAISRR